ncbi:MAG: hypothetical protein IJ448_02150 [Oscillospiraceae bacterium]|nr:hypothetical protein [Oscillospiraceae bacterium]
MKKLFAITLALVLCLSALGIGVWAASDYYCIAGTMNGWNANSSDRMTDNGDGTYSYTFANMAAGEYEFKFTVNGSWDTCYGGAFLGSGQESDLYSPGSNIKFTLAEAADVVILLNMNTNKFTVTIGNQVDAPVGKIKIHVSVPEGWGDAYVYVWNPEHLGSWSGTKVENGVIEVTAKFEGLIVNNGSGKQTADIKDIDLTKEEVWIVVDSYNGYTLYYSDPGKVEEEVVPNIKVHVIVPEAWGDVYAYVWNPEHLGSWSGTKVENGVFELPAKFEGMIINNGNGLQTADIKDIDLTKSEVWIVVDSLGGYTLSYTEPAPGEQEPDVKPIKIHIIAKNWTEVYAYTFNPELDGTWPGTKVENGVFETLHAFEGLVLSNGNGQQTWDVKDIDKDAQEVWIIVGEANAEGKCEYTLSYTEPVNSPTGDPIGIVVALLAVSGLGICVLGSKKKEF